MGIESLALNSKYPDFEPCSGKLLVVASAKCWLDDLEQVWPWDGDVMAINDIIMHYPGYVKHAFSNDSQMLMNWVRARRPVRDGSNRPSPIRHTCMTAGKVALIWPWPGHGTSSLNAVYTGLALGYDDIVLCGIPMDNSPHYWEAEYMGKRWASLEGQMRFWQYAARKVFDGKVTSLSGNTRELLGEPRHHIHHNPLLREAGTP